MAHEPATCFMVDLIEAGEFAVRPDNGQRMTRAELPPGAMWEAPWMGDAYRINGSGPVLVVVLPDGREWMPGSVAANCTRRGEDHDCWCVHGDAPMITVDKNPEPGRTTCNAGAGSIGPSKMSGHDWHGFLQQGRLVGV